MGSDTTINTPETTNEPVDKLGMTGEQWEWFQKATHGYGDQDENGIDSSLIRCNLRQTLTKRLQRNSGSFSFFVAAGRAEKVPDLRKIFVRLATARSRFVLIGATAMVAHGSAHITQDVDLACDWSAESVKLLACTFLPQCPNGLLDERQLRQTIALTTDLGPVDLHGSLPGVDSFEQLWENSVVLELYGTSVHVAGVGDLIAMKRAANRLQDQNHILELEALRKLAQEENNSDG